MNAKRHEDERIKDNAIRDNIITSIRKRHTNPPSPLNTLNEMYKDKEIVCYHRQIRINWPSPRFHRHLAKIDMYFVKSPLEALSIKENDQGDRNESIIVPKYANKNLTLY